MSRSRSIRAAAVATAATVLGGVLMTAPSAAASALVDARNRFFGAANVDQSTGAVRPDRVVASWVGVSTFALAIGGHVVLLDAWIPDIHPRSVPATPADLAALRPSRIFIGHGHFDHALDAVPIARATGAEVVGTAEHCTDLRAQWPDLLCTAVSPAGSALGATSTYDGLPGVAVDVVRNLHSGITRPDGSHKPFLPLPPSLKVLSALRDPRGALEAVKHFGDPEGGALTYRFTLDDFALVWHDSSGPLVDSPGGDEVIAALRGWAGADVQLGAIQGYNEFTNGFRDPVTYIEAVQPATFVPNHHDDWLPVIAVPAARMEAPFRRSLATSSHQPELRYLLDPRDYVRPDVLTWHVG
jgi:L-ascorbate metabolism protein UlaG (beta-lactamase superfamily)